MPHRSEDTSTNPEPGPIRVIEGREFLTTSRCEAMRQTIGLIRHFGASCEPVHFHGERGTGKSWAAELLHSYSPRAREPYRYLNLAGLDDSLASSELFGHTRGAFTDAKQNRKGLLAEAGDGSLLLDEIGKTSLVLQRKLLDVMERMAFRPVGSDRDVRLRARLVFAASEPLEALVKSGGMLPDFLSRLGLFRIALPPLRERRDDVSDLLAVALRRRAALAGVHAARVPGPTDALLQALRAYDWPGNLRELEAVAARLLVDARGSPTIGTDLLIGDLARYRGTGASASRRSRMPSPQELRRTIKASKNNKSEAARRHGIGRTSAWRVLRGEVDQKPAPGEREASP